MVMDGLRHHVVTFQRFIILFPRKIISWSDQPYKKTIWCEGEFYGHNNCWPDCVGDPTVITIVGQTVFS